MLCVLFVHVVCIYRAFGYAMCCVYTLCCYMLCVVFVYVVCIYVQCSASTVKSPLFTVQCSGAVFSVQCSIQSYQYSGGKCLVICGSIIRNCECGKETDAHTHGTCNGGSFHLSNNTSPFENMSVKKSVNTELT